MQPKVPRQTASQRITKVKPKVQAKLQQDYARNATINFMDLLILNNIYVVEIKG
jgi:hypothetical protein